MSHSVAYTGDQAFATLTDEIIARARCADTAARAVLRCRKRGLELHLYRSGKPARWYARPRVGGDRLRLNLGSLAALPTVAEAHAALTQELVRADRHGVAVLGDRATFAGLVEDFLADFEKARRSRSAENYRGALERFAIPALGAKKLRQLRRADFVECIEATHSRLQERGLKGAEANTLRAALQSAWRWGMKKGRVDVDIVARLPAPASADPRATTATDEQLLAFWHATAPGSEAPISNLMGAAFRVAMVTAQRIGAVLLTLASDLDLNEGTWAIHPQYGTKVPGPLDHVVPLPPLAQQVWREALAISEATGSRPVFPADRGRTSAATTIRQDSAANAMVRLRTRLPHLGAITLHDLRRTARTRISGACHRESAERWLGHVIGSKIERTYDTDQHLGEKREAAIAWEGYLGRLSIKPG